MKPYSVEQPPITDIDELLTQRQVADFFGKGLSTVRDWMRGHKGLPPLPYVRVAQQPLFSKRQIAWWLRQVQEQGDPSMANVRHARREMGLDR